LAPGIRRDGVAGEKRCAVMAPLKPRSAIRPDRRDKISEQIAPNFILWL
jgi:hypothetical protein